MVPFGYTIFHVVFNFTGVLFNLTLICLILTKSPKYMKPYTILVLNLSCADFAATVMDFLTQARMIALEKSLFYVYEAACSRVSSWLCFMCENTLMMVHSQNVWLLLLSFIYRFVLLKTGEFSNIKLYTSLIVIYLISITQLILFFPNAIFDMEVVAHLQVSFPFETFVMDNKTSYHGLADLNIWNNQLGTLNIIGPTTPFFIIEIVILYKVHTFMDTSSMSAETKKLHKQFFKALACQAVLPLVTLITIIMFMIPRTGLMESHQLQYGTFALLNTKPTFSALFDLYFIRAFRNEIKSWFKKYVRCETIVIHDVPSNPTSLSKPTFSAARSQRQ